MIEYVIFAVYFGNASVVVSVNCLSLNISLITYIGIAYYNAAERKRSARAVSDSIGKLMSLFLGLNKIVFPVNFSHARGFEKSVFGIFFIALLTRNILSGNNSPARVFLNGYHI